MMKFVEFRNKKGLNQAEMARLLGTTRGTIVNIEKDLPISQRLAVRIQLFSGGKIQALNLTIPEYDTMLVEEKRRLEGLIESFRIYQKTLSG